MTLTRTALTAGCATLALVATACTSGSTPDDPTVTSSSATPTTPSTGTASTAPTSTAPTSATPTTSTATTPPLALAATPQGTSAMNPTTPITLTASHGTLQSVTVTNADGKAVSGTFSADHTGWHSTEVLGYGKSYRMVAKATGDDDSSRTLKRTFTTLTPNNMTMPYLQTIYGSKIQNGGTYGVGMIPVVRFDENIVDKAAAEKALVVTTSPHVDGSWYWVNDYLVHWRPKNYYASGTKVTVTAKMYGVNVGNDMYGQADQSVSFTIGRKQITIAEDNSPKVDKVLVYRNGSLIRSMNTSMGKHYGITTSKGDYINFFTLDGAYTVLGFENPAKMCSDSYGLPADEGGYACENIPWATKISVDGIYLHELETTTWAQNSGYDVSHGCLNLNQANAQWFFQNSLIGDPVVVKGAKGAPTIKVWQGGDWQVSWKTWQAGSALA